MRSLFLGFVGAAALACASCSGAANIAGDYSVSVTDGANGCNLADFTQGDTATGITVTITQSGSDATLVVGGAVGLEFEAALGSATFTGKVDGQHFELTLYGTRSYTMNSCTYTLDTTISGDEAADVIEGTATYKAATNGSPDCGSIQGCSSVQTFNGTRPPS